MRTIDLTALTTSKLPWDFDTMTISFQDGTKARISVASKSEFDLLFCALFPIAHAQVGSIKIAQALDQSFTQLRAHGLDNAEPSPEFRSVFRFQIAQALSLLKVKGHHGVGIEIAGKPMQGGISA